ncbi:protein farnesyltransferase/geranylgeranyltransferase type-1 subunit alpha, partial [Phenoliferia sp. Uapishka_3]
MSEGYTPYAVRSDWTDLVPMKQDDAPNALVPIAYTAQYRDAMDLFRALVKAGEKSPRALDLTEDLIRMNPGHYSIWSYRARILLETQADLSLELDLMDELVKEHLKSYQVWQHRRTIVLALGSSSRELPFTSRALSLDSKNYHTWAYRQWVLCEFFSSSKDGENVKEKEVWEGEGRYVEGLLEDDIRNNSAWNHRFFCEVARRGTVSKEVLDGELEFVKSKLALAPNNPSAWNYIRGLLKTTSTPLASLVPFVAPFAIPPTPDSSSSSDSSASETDSKPSLPAFLAIEFLADACAEEAVKGKAVEKGKEAAALFESLIQYDPIRTKYWQYRAAQVVKA